MSGTETESGNGDFPAPTEGFVLTHTIIVKDRSVSCQWYERMLDGKVVMELSETGGALRHQIRQQLDRAQCWGRRPDRGQAKHDGKSERRPPRTQRVLEYQGCRCPGFLSNSPGSRRGIYY